MIGNIITKVFGSTHDRYIKKLMPTVDKINEIFESYKNLSEEDFLQNTAKFQERLKNGETVEVPVTCRLDTADEVLVYEAGGVLQRFAQDFLESNAS